MTSRLDFAPIVDYVAARCNVDYWVERDTGRLIHACDGVDVGRMMPSHGDIARALGVNRATVLRAVHHGLSPLQADRYAVRLGFHPLELWPEFHTIAMTDTKELTCLT